MQRRAEAARRSELGMPLVAHQRLPLPDAARTPRRTRSCSASRPARRSRTNALEVRDRPALREEAAGDARTRSRDVPEAIANTIEVARRCELELKTASCQFPDVPGRPRRTLETRSTRGARRGLEERLRRAAAVSATDRPTTPRPTRTASTTSWRSSTRWASPATSSSSPTSSTGAKGRASRSGRAAARRPAAWSRTRSASPTSTRLQYDLLFERFLNPERGSMPDIDVDFCFERRDEVIRYVREKYGEDRVAQIITFGTLKGKRPSRTSGASSSSRSARPTASPSSTRRRSRGRTTRSSRRSRWSRGCASCATSGEREGRLFDLALRFQPTGCAWPLSQSSAALRVVPRDRGRSGTLGTTARRKAEHDTQGGTRRTTLPLGSSGAPVTRS